MVEVAAPPEAAATEPASISRAEPAAGQMEGDDAAPGSPSAVVQRQAFAMDGNVQLVALAAAALLGEVRRGAAAGAAPPAVAAGPCAAAPHPAALPATPKGSPPDASEVLHRPF